MFIEKMSAVRAILAGYSLRSPDLLSCCSEIVYMDLADLDRSSKWAKRSSCPTGNLQGGLLNAAVLSTYFEGYQFWKQTTSGGNSESSGQSSGSAGMIPNI